MKQEKPVNERSAFVTDLDTIRRRARQRIEEGAVTKGYEGDPQAVVRLLNDALATEIVCVLRYRRHYFMAQGMSSESVKKEFLQHANEEQGHADQLAERIVQLGGEPNLSPDGMLSRSHSEYIEGLVARAPKFGRRRHVAQRICKVGRIRGNVFNRERSGKRSQRSLWWPELGPHVTKIAVAWRKLQRTIREWSARAQAENWDRGAVRKIVAE